MNKIIKRIIGGLAGAALAISIPVATTSPAEAVVRQRIVNSAHSDKSLIVAKYFNGRGADRVVPRGQASPYLPTRSFYVPRGCDAKIAKGNWIVSRRNETGWHNLGPRYATGHWIIELWCTNGTGGGQSW